MSEPLKAFIVTDSEYFEDVGSSLVYAESVAQARSLGAHELGIDYAYVRGTRKPEYDSHATGEPRVERDGAVLRRLGWRCEDENQCESCGLYPMDLDQFEVCTSCALCKECGHDDECEKNEKEPT